MIVEAGKALFNSEPKIIIRLPQAGDDNIQQVVPTEKTTVNNEEKKKINDSILEIPEQAKVFTPKEKESRKETVDTKDIARLESDQEKMILELFDGKYIE